MRTAFATYIVGAALVSLVSVAGPAARQLKSVTAETGAPVLVESGGGGSTFAMTLDEYQKLAAQLAKVPAFVAITKPPPGAGPDTRYGINFTFGGKNLGWALIGNDAGGYTLYPDANGNGDLSDDTPLKLDKSGDKYAAYFETTVTEAAGSYPVRFKLILEYLTAPGKTEKALALTRIDTMRRTGETTIDGAPMKFAISSSQGLYDEPYVGLRIDLDRNGAFDPVVEVYRNSEKYFNVGDKTYEFKTDRYGRSVTFTELAEKRPARVVLLPGYPAPDISFADLDGKTHKLSDYKGSVVLIDFWGTWCGPCVAVTPELVAAREKYHARGFEIIGVDSSDTKEKLLAFMAEKKMTWPQTMEDSKGPLATLFRVNGWPTYFLVDRNGNFASAGENGNFQLQAELAKLFPEKDR